MTQLERSTPAAALDGAADSGGPSEPAWPVWPFVAALVAAPLLGLVGLAFEPPGAYGSERAMVQAYVGSPGRVDVQATGLHLAYVLAALGLFGAGAVVRGRGRGLALAGGFLSLLGFGFMSSFLLMDWVTVAVAQETDVATTLAVDDAIGGVGFVIAWILPQMIGLLVGPPLVVAGLARAGLLPWWALALPAAVLVVSALISNDQWGPYLAFALYGALGWWIAWVIRAGRRGRGKGATNVRTA